MQHCRTPTSATAVCLCGRGLLKTLTVFHLIKKFLCVFRSVSIRCRVFKSPKFSPVHSQITPVYALTSYFFNAHFNNLSSTPRSSKWSLFFRLPTNTHHSSLSSPLSLSFIRSPLHQLIPQYIRGTEFQRLSPVAHHLTALPTLSVNYRQTVHFQTLATKLKLFFINTEVS